MPEAWPLFRVIGQASRPDVSAEVALGIYRDMILLRTFDEKSITLQRQGRVGTFPPSLGQEAAEIGSAWALARTDWLVPSYRDHGALYVHGVPFAHVVLFAMGKGQSIAGEARVLPNSVPISSHLPHAVGLAMAAQTLDEDAIAIAYFGDGGTSEGDFHEALNFAAVFKAPVIFFCQNNGWAISVPVSRQTATKTLVEKSVAYGMRGIRVDGNDALAVYQAVKEARARAVGGEGPTLIEAVTYRIGPHTTADDPTRYRSAEELAEWTAAGDPIDRLRVYLEGQGWLAPDETERIRAAARERVNAAVEEAEAAPPVRSEAMFAAVYAELPEALIRQRADLSRFDPAQGGGAGGRH